MSEGRRPAIKLVETETKGSISAKYLLWFAWASEGIDGPEGEKVDLDYQPLAFDVKGIAQVTVTATASDLWSHHPGNTSDAAGINDERGLENPAYRSAMYNSEKILPLTARLNLLVGMVAKDQPPEPDGLDVEQIKIGLSRTIPIDDVNATHLFLGFHDGRQWSNNDGAVNVTVRIDKRR